MGTLHKHVTTESAIMFRFVCHDGHIGAMGPDLRGLLAIPPPTQHKITRNVRNSDSINDCPHVSIWAVLFMLDPVEFVAVAIVEWHRELGSGWAFAIIVTLG